PIGVGADLIGRRKPFAVGGIFISGLGALGMAIAPDPWSLFAARTVTGIGAAAWVAISVLYASYWRPERAAMAMATVMGLTQAAQVLATLTGGILAEQFGLASTFWIGGVAGVLGTLAMTMASEPGMPPRTYSWSTFGTVARSPALLAVSGISITVQFVTFSTSFGFVPVFARELGASKAEIGYVTTAMFAASGVGALGSAFLVQRIGYRLAILVAACIVALAMLVVPSTERVGLLIAGQAFGGLGRGALNTLLIALALQAAPPAERGTAMGIFQAIYAIGMLSGPVVSGAVADSYGLSVLFYVVAGISIIGGTLALLTPWLPRPIGATQPVQPGASKRG
ncbi:MAG: MFS transporter, partial [Chloroflexi bacterium]|nr:MFS transporter [Chloroflexota bacterium]